MDDADDEVLVFGGSGFLGAHVLRQLVQGAPRRVVKAVVRSDASAAKVRALGAEPVIGDVGADAGDAGWRAVAAGARHVVHCAQPAPRAGGYLEARLQMDRAILSALDPAVVQRAVFVYGSSYYGVTGDGKTADEAMSPRRPFGLGPLFEPAVEALHEAMARGLDAVAAYPGGIYARGSWFLEMYLAALQKDEPIVIGASPPVWPYLHAGDCARAVDFLLTVAREKLDAEGRDVILADDEPAPMDHFIRAMGEIVGRAPRLTPWPEAKLRERLPPMTFLYLTSSMAHSNARLRRLGFTCAYPRLRDGLASLGLPRL